MLTRRDAEMEQTLIENKQTDSTQLNQLIKTIKLYNNLQNISNIWKDQLTVG